MCTKKIISIFILTLFLTSCSTENLPTNNTNETSYLLVEKSNGTKSKGYSGEISDKSYSLEVKYIKGLSLNQVHNLRTKYASFVGLKVVIVKSSTLETWVVDADVYDSYCYKCIVANKCCRDQVVEGDDDIEKVNLVKIKL